MEFDPFNISSLKNQIAESEKIITELKEELEGKNQEKTRMEKQIIKLTDNIANKDQTIDDLTHKIKILQESIEDLVDKVNVKEENRKMNEFLKSELEKREKEVVLLTRERDMLNWKLIHEGTTETDVEQERNNLQDKNHKLSNQNSNLASDLDKLSEKLDLLAQRNANLTSELEKRSKFTEQLQVDFEEAIQSRNKILTEFESLKRKLSEVQKSIQTASTSTSRRLLRGTTSDRPSLIPRRSKLSTSKTQRQVPSYSKLPPTKPGTSITQLTPLSSIETSSSSASTLFKNVEENIVRKIVHNIQSSFTCAPVISPNAKPYLLVQPQPPLAQSSVVGRSTKSQDEVDEQTRKIAIDSIRQMLESKLIGSSAGQISNDPSFDSKYLKARSLESSSSASERERKNQGL